MSCLKILLFIKTYITHSLRKEARLIEGLKNTEEKLPEGFEHASDNQIRFHTAEQKRPQQLHFGRRGGSRGIGQVIERPKDSKRTLSRLVGYFKMKKLLILLITSVLTVTITSLAAPALQGDGIDLIIQHSWSNLYRLLMVLLAVYLIHECFGTAGS